MNSSSKTSPMQTRYLSRRPVTLARCQSPWGSLGLHSLAILSSCLLAATPSLRGPWPQDSRQIPHLLFLRRSEGVQLHRPRTALAAGRPTSGTPLSMTTSPRKIRRTLFQAHPAPTHPLLLSSPFKEALQHLLSSWVTSLLLNQWATQRSLRLYQRRKTNTVSFS